LDDATISFVVLGAAVALFIWNRLLVLVMAMCALLTALITVNGAVAALLPIVVVAALRLDRPTSLLVRRQAVAMGAAAKRSLVVLASLLVDTVGTAGPYALLAGLFALTAVLGQIISNSATALIVIPIAVSAAGELAVSARSLWFFAVALALIPRFWRF
jgi:di/tricarboxylate transporter